jgi:lipopolysaccharide transport system ATP-binding protein
MVIATHNLEIARAWCTRAIRLEGGRIVADGPVEAVVAAAEAAAVVAAWPDKTAAE